MNDKRASHMPSTLSPGAFKTTFPLKFPLKVNNKGGTLPAYAFGSPLQLNSQATNLGKGPGTYSMSQNTFGRVHPLGIKAAFNAGAFSGIPNAPNSQSARAPAANAGTALPVRDVSISVQDKQPHSLYHLGSDVFRFDNWASNTNNRSFVTSTERLMRSPDRLQNMYMALYQVRRQINNRLTNIETQIKNLEEQHAKAVVPANRQKIESQIAELKQQQARLAQAKATGNDLVRLLTRSAVANYLAFPVSAPSAEAPYHGMSLEALAEIKRKTGIDITALNSTDVNEMIGRFAAGLIAPETYSAHSRSSNDPLVQGVTADSLKRYRAVASDPNKLNNDLNVALANTAFDPNMANSIAQEQTNLAIQEWDRYANIAWDATNYYSQAVYDPNTRTNPANTTGGVAPGDAGSGENVNQQKLEQTGLAYLNQAVNSTKDLYSQAVNETLGQSTALTDEEKKQAIQQGTSLPDEILKDINTLYFLKSRPTVGIDGKVLNQEERAVLEQEITQRLQQRLQSIGVNVPPGQVLTEVMNNPDIARQIASSGVQYAKSSLEARGDFDTGRLLEDKRQAGDQAFSQMLESTDAGQPPKWAENQYSLPEGWERQAYENLQASHATIQDKNKQEIEVAPDPNELPVDKAWWQKNMGYYSDAQYGVFREVYKNPALRGKYNFEGRLAHLSQLEQDLQQATQNVLATGGYGSRQFQRLKDRYEATRRMLQQDILRAQKDLITYQQAEQKVKAQQQDPNAPIDQQAVQQQFLRDSMAADWQNTLRNAERARQLLGNAQVEREQERQQRMTTMDRLIEQYGPDIDNPQSPAYHQVPEHLRYVDTIGPNGLRQRSTRHLYRPTEEAPRVNVENWTPEAVAQRWKQRQMQQFYEKGWGSTPEAAKQFEADLDAIINNRVQPAQQPEAGVNPNQAYQTPKAPPTQQVAAVRPQLPQPTASVGALKPPTMPKLPNVGGLA